MSAQEYLKTQGIEPEKYILVAYIDGVMRNVDLKSLLDGYADIINEERDDLIRYERVD
jgi:hypothetical protein